MPGNQNKEQFPILVAKKNRLSAISPVHHMVMVLIGTTHPKVDDLSALELLVTKVLSTRSKTRFQSAGDSVRGIIFLASNEP